MHQEICNEQKIQRIRNSLNPGSHRCLKLADSYQKLYWYCVGKAGTRAGLPGPPAHLRGPTPRRTPELDGQALWGNYLQVAYLILKHLSDVVNSYPNCKMRNVINPKLPTMTSENWRCKSISSASTLHICRSSSHIWFFSLLIFISINRSYAIETFDISTFPKKSFLKFKADNFEIFTFSIITK